MPCLQQIHWIGMTYSAALLVPTQQQQALHKTSKLASWGTTTRQHNDLMYSSMYIIQLTTRRKQEEAAHGSSKL